MSPKKSWLALGTVGLLSLTPSFADTVSYSNTTAATSPEFAIGFSLPAFDSNLGTLDNIALSYSILASGTLEVSNNGSIPFAGYGGQIQSVNLLSTPSNVGPGLGPEIIPVGIGVGGTPPVGSSSASGDGGASGSVVTNPSTYGLWEALGGGTLSFCPSGPKCDLCGRRTALDHVWRHHHGRKWHVHSYL